MSDSEPKPELVLPVPEEQERHESEIDLSLVLTRHHFTDGTTVTQLPSPVDGKQDIMLVTHPDGEVEDEPRAPEKHRPYTDRVARVMLEQYDKTGKLEVPGRH